MQLRQLTQTSPDELKEHILSTYLTLRYGMAIVTLLFPAAVYFSGLLSGVDLQSSLSAYYWADATGPNTPRAVFVGGLFAIGAFMYLYKGYTRAENIALNFAAVFGVGVALVPMASTSAHWDPGFWHGSLAVATFVCLFYVVWFQSTKTLDELPEGTASGPVTKRFSRKWYEAQYTVIAIVMLASPVTAAVLDLTIGKQSYVFFIESAGVVTFGWYWLAKSSELERSSAETKATSGQLRVK